VTTIEATHTETRTHVEIPVDGSLLAGGLSLPASPDAAIVFAHAGANDLDPRSDRITVALAEAGFATLALDLHHEDPFEPESLFDAPLLAHRLTEATRWLRGQMTLPIGYLGVGTGGSAALWAAAGAEAGVFAIVCLGSWPDLAASQLSLVRAPTLLVVGGVDGHLLERNRAALEELPACEHSLAVVAGATHLFEQFGALEQATKFATDWFTGHLGGRASLGS
jgi:putative phosphoribosyl transferase